METPKLSALIRLGAAMNPCLTAKLNRRRNLNRGAFAQVIDGIAHTSAIGAAYAALWGEAPTNELDSKVCRALLEACGINNAFLRSEAGEYVNDPLTWVLEHEDGAITKPVLYQIERWESAEHTREQIAAYLEQAGL